MFSDEEKIGLSEAYKVYVLLSEENKKSIPENFVNKMKLCYRNDLGADIKTLEDIKDLNVSRAGVINISCLMKFVD